MENFLDFTERKLAILFFFLLFITEQTAKYCMKKRPKTLVFCLLITALAAILLIGNNTTSFADSSNKPTADELPEQVTNLTCTKSTQKSVTLEWYNLYYNVDGYEICQYNTTTKKYKHVKYLSGAHTCSAAISKLSAGKKYYFSVRGYIVVNGKKYFGPRSSKLAVATTPKAVTLKKVSYISKGKINIQWGKRTTADGYLLQYSTSKKFTDNGKTTTIVVKKGTTTSKKIGGLASTTYYVRIAPYKTANKLYYVGKWSNTKSVAIKNGLNLKELLNYIKTDNSGRAAIKEMTNNGVDIKKYKTTYDKVMAIYRWHTKNSRKFQDCLACNSSFNTCLIELLDCSEQRNIWIAAGYYRNNSGSKSIHKWSAVYLAGIPYYFDPRMQGYINTSGSSYFGFRKGSSLSKQHYIFENWYYCSNDFYNYYFY